MDQSEFTTVFCARPQNYAWFLGAGASRTAGLPTATDIIWDLKRRYYCREENQDISRQDVQNPAVRDRIQSFMESRGFPEEWADNEYPTYFEKIFGADKERQRKYLKAILSEDKLTLSAGNRVLGALMVSGLCRAAFTTNFDSVVEKAVAEIGGMSLSGYHLEGSHAANEALNNEEYPLYCKLHGDFRHDSLKNLPADLAEQNEALSRCLVNAGNRFGFVVTGYSGRDESIMALFRSVLVSANPFPHGLFWTGMKGSPIPTAVESLIEEARQNGVDAHYVAIETFDALLLRLWRNIEDKPAKLDAKVHKTETGSVEIPLPQTGRGRPLLRFNALPVLSLPRQCLSLSFRTPKDWDDLRQARRDSEHRLILTKSDSVWCWGTRAQVRDTFGKDVSSIGTRDLPADLESAENLHVKGFLDEAICAAMARGRPLLSRVSRSSAFLIADPHTEDVSGLDPLFAVVGKTSGTVPGLFTVPTEDHPHPEKISWAEALRVSIDQRNGKLWLLIGPDIWIWPPRARRDAAAFLDERRADRYNKKHNDLLDAWIRLIFGTDERNAEIAFSAFDEGDEAENPSFRIGSRTAFARRLAS